jgi:choline dehydrogenase-like flavoprotein
MVLSQLFDVIVVGSGAGGGMCSHVLTRAGMKVLLLEAGRDYDPVSETPMFNLPKEAPLRGAATPDKPRGFYDATIDGGWQVPGEPYTVAEGSEFKWWRARMLGGRTNHWGRVSLRYGPYDFKPYSRDGLGVDWPLTYEELEAWYDKTEELIGVTGARHGLENTPDSPSGVHLTPPPPSPSEYFVSRGFQGLGIPVAAARLAILTRPLNGRPPCLQLFRAARYSSVPRAKPAISRFAPMRWSIRSISISRVGPKASVLSIASLGSIIPSTPKQSCSPPAPASPPGFC